MLLVPNPYLPCLVGLEVYGQNRRIVVLHISDGVARSICACICAVSVSVEHANLLQRFEMELRDARSRSAAFTSIYNSGKLTDVLD